MDKIGQDRRTVAWDIRPFIGGRYMDSSGGDEVDDVAPATGEKLCGFSAGNREDVDRAVAAARAAFDSGVWSGMGPMSRKALLHRYCELIERDAQRLALLDCLEMGKPISHALSDAGTIAPLFARYYAESIDKIYGQTAHSDAGSLCFTLLEPRGVVGAIVPWNFPVVNAVIKLFPALAAGNAIVLKPSELAPASALLLAELAMEAGLPEGIVNVVPGLGNTVGAALASHPDVDFLTFTGSTATGRELMRLSANAHAAPMMLECGGKSPSVVFADVVDDLDAVAAEIVGEALANQGQVCVARSRVIVQASILDGLAERISAAVSGLVAGDPFDPATMFGPLASRMQADRVRALIASARAEGAGVVHDAHAGSDGCVVNPVVFRDVTPRMRIWREEVFGPVIGLTAFSDVDEALRLANDTGYGLSATVWTRDLEIAQHMLRGIRAGEVSVRANGTACEGAGFALPQEPRKASGFGAEAGLDGMRSYMTIKKVGLHAA